MNARTVPHMTRIAARTPNAAAAADTVPNAIDDVRRYLFGGYAHEHRPLGAYAAMVALFNALFVGFLALTKASNKPLPERIQPSDLLLLGVATHKASRLIARDWVTSFVRAPFTRYEGPSEMPAEVDEEPRGRGFRLMLGELLTCPFCVGQWVAAALGYGLVLQPRVARFIGGIFAILAISDWLHLAYVVLEEKTEPEGGEKEQEQPE